MGDDLDSDELRAIVSELEQGNSETRERAFTGLRRLVGFALNRAATRERLNSSEQMRRWGEIEEQTANRPDVANALINALEDPSAGVRGFAAIELRNVTSVEAEDALVRHLRTDAHYQVRMMCVSSLRSRRPTPQVDVFIEALADLAEQVVFVACMALGETCDARAEAPLRRVLDHTSWRVRYRACEALMRLQKVNARVVAELEALVSAPEAAEHDRMVERANELDRRFGDGGAALSCRQVLDGARRLLEANGGESR